MRRLLIYAPDMFSGDAIGNYCFGLYKLAKRLKITPILFAQRSHQFSENGKVNEIDTIFSIITDEDILMIHFSIYDECLNKLLSLNCKKIIYFHGITPPSLLEDFEPDTARLCAKALQQLPELNRANLLITNSVFNKIILDDAVIGKNISIIPPLFHDQGIFKASHRTSLKKFNSENIKFLFVGRVVPHKKLEDILKLLAHIKNENTKISLSIVGNLGNDKYFKFLLNLARNLKILEMVQFHGMLSEELLNDEYNKSDIYISMSSHEGFSVPVIEALHKGCHVIVKRGTAADEFEGGCISLLNDSMSYAQFLKIISDKEIITQHCDMRNNLVKNILSKSFDSKYLEIFGQ